MPSPGEPIVEVSGPGHLSIRPLARDGVSVTGAVATTCLVGMPLGALALERVHELSLVFGFMILGLVATLALYMDLARRVVEGVVPRVTRELSVAPRAATTYRDTSSRVLTIDGVELAGPVETVWIATATIDGRVTHRVLLGTRDELVEVVGGVGSVRAEAVAEALVQALFGESGRITRRRDVQPDAGPLVGVLLGLPYVAGIVVLSVLCDGRGGPALDRVLAVLAFVVVQIVVSRTVSAQIRPRWLAAFREELARK